MQRYSPKDDGDGIPYGEECSNGRFVLFADAQSALLAKEEEIAKLRDALQEMTAHVLVLSPSDPGDCPICDKARQALSRDTTGASK